MGRASHSAFQGTSKYQKAREQASDPSAPYRFFEHIAETGSRRNRTVCSQKASNSVMSLQMALDLGGTKLAFGVVDQTAPKLLHCGVERIPRSTSFDTVVNFLLDRVAKLNSTYPDIKKIGVAVPGKLDPKDGTWRASNNLPQGEVNLLSALRRILPDSEIAFQTDAYAAALAEAGCGMARGYRRALVLTIGTGVGGRLVAIDRSGTITVGPGSRLQHIVVDPGGPRCQGICPNHGCLESSCSGTAITRKALRYARQHSKSRLGRIYQREQKVDGARVSRLAKDGDPVSQKILRDSGKQLGIGLASLSGVFGVDRFVVVGSVSKAGNYFLKAAREELRWRTKGVMNATVVRGRFGAKAALIGAGLMDAKKTAESLPPFEYLPIEY